MPTLKLTAREWAMFYNDHPDQLDAYFKSVDRELNKANTRIAALGEELNHLYDFVEKVAGNFETCEYCGGTGKNPRGDDECPKCNNGLRIASVGVLYVEIPQEAAKILRTK